MLKRIASLMLSALLLVGCDKPGDAPSFPSHAIDMTWRYAEADFRLTDTNGRPRTMADFRDKVTILFFGYTHCPEVCPTTLADLAQVMRQLGTDADRVQVLFVTLDPARDTPELLAKFVPSFDSRFLGLYGGSEATARAAQAFGVNYEKQPGVGGDYTLDHTDGSYLVGIGGKPVLLSRYGQRTELLVEDIRLLLGAAQKKE